MKTHLRIYMAFLAFILIGISLWEVKVFAQDIDDTVEGYEFSVDESPVEVQTGDQDNLAIELDEEVKVFSEQQAPRTKRVPVRENQDLKNFPLVEVEPSYAITSDLTGELLLIPYRVRRERWGHSISISYSDYLPDSYTPNFITAEFDDIYQTPSTPLLELTYVFKRNFKVGSLGLEAGVGIYENESASELVDSSLTLIPVRVGVQLVLDTLFFEPYVAPYGSAGVYSVLYKEESVSASFNGTTQVAPYFSFGLLFQLDWLDRASARESYLESGIENTFIYMEGRQFIASSAEKDPNFETDVHWNAGLKLEF